MAAINEQGEIDLRACLTSIGFTTDRQRDAIVAEGFSSIGDLGDISTKDVGEMCKKISTQPNNRGGVRIGYNLVRRLKGFVFWVKDHHRRGQTPVEANWNLEICKESLDKMDIEEKSEKDDTKIDAPGKLKPADWLQWELKLINFLQSISGASGVPLNYIIRKDVAEGYEFANDSERLIHTCPIEGTVYNADNRKVFGFIKQSVADTTNWDWIKTLNRSQDGRGAMKLLRDHFDGPGEVEKRIANANQAMEGLHYIKESTFPFSSYVTGLNACYKTLEEAGEPMTERNKVATMLKGIQNVNAYVTAAIQNVRTRAETKNNFTTASNELSEQIAIIFPGEIRRPGNRGGGNRRMAGLRGGRGGNGGGGRGHDRGQYQGNRGGRGGYRGGRGGRGGGRGGGRNILDGIDVSDVTRAFSDTEWSSLTSESRRHVHEERQRKRQRTEGRGGEQRGIAAANTEGTGDQNVVPDDATNNTNNGGAAGRAVGFGRGAYRGRGRGAARG